MSFNNTDEPDSNKHEHPDNINDANPSNINGGKDPDPEHPAELSPSAEEAYAAVHGYKPSDSPEEAAREMLKDALVPAVNTIVQLSMFSANERIRSENAKLIVEMNLGKVGARTQPLGDMWDELLKELTGGTGDGNTNGHKTE